MSNFNDKDFDDFGSEFDESFELDKKLENSGSGFAVEEDVDASSMLEESMRYSEKDPDDSPTIVSNDAKETVAKPVDHENASSHGVGAEVSPSERTSTDSSTNENKSSSGGATIASNHEVTEVKENSSEDLSRVNDDPPTPVAHQTSNREVTEQPRSEPQGTVQQDMRPRIAVPNNETELKRVGTIINILDAYRKLSGEEKTVVSQFVNNGNPINNESEFVISVLNVDRMLTRTIIALREAKSTDPVERAFYVIELDENVFYALGSLVEVFTNNTINVSLSKTQYARELVKSIEMLDQTSMRFVEATETVLKVVEA